MPLAHATRLGPYEIVSQIGSEFMGEVYKARDTRLGRDVAIKLVAEDFSRRFELEARTSRRSIIPASARCTTSGLTVDDIFDWHLLAIRKG